MQNTIKKIPIFGLAHKSLYKFSGCVWVITDELVGDEQEGGGGLQCGKCADQIFAMRQIIEKACE